VTWIHAAWLFCFGLFWVAVNHSAPDPGALRAKDDREDL
jgi:hypothetical protein